LKTRVISINNRSNEENESEEVLPGQVYSEGELKKRISATEQGSFERVLVMVPAVTGFRISEVLGLTWPAVDFKVNKIHVRLKPLVDESKENGGQDVKAPKSKKSRRV
jgi:integrase